MKMQVAKVGISIAICLILFGLAHGSYCHVPGEAQYRSSICYNPFFEVPSIPYGVASFFVGMILSIVFVPLHAETAGAILSHLITAAIFIVVGWGVGRMLDGARRT
jgi:VIT1/CCC1 family predicted Fe2+/Mn2+ transporter